MRLGSIRHQSQDFGSQAQCSTWTALIQPCLRDAQPSLSLQSACVLAVRDKLYTAWSYYVAKLLLEHREAAELPAPSTYINDWELIPIQPPSASRVVVLPDYCAAAGRLLDHHTYLRGWSYL